MLEAPYALLWTDVETTGLDPQEHLLLQAAGFITTVAGTEATAPFQHIVKQELQAAFARANSYVQQMHTATGLWERLATGEELATVDRSLLAYINSHVAPETEVRLAGNSVRLDMNFLERYLPHTYARLSYRVVDVSGLAFVLKENGLVPAYYEKKKSHDAVEDIQESLAEYLYLLEHIKAPV